MYKAPGIRLGGAIEREGTGWSILEWLGSEVSHVLHERFFLLVFSRSNTGRLDEAAGLQCDLISEDLKVRCGVALAVLSVVRHCAWIPPAGSAKS